MQKIGKKFWLAMVLLGFIGQVAWVVENMYFNVFIYKMFHATAADISLMVSASAVAATLTTILIGALTDKLGKRKIFICGGYLIWGISILGFGLIRMDILTPICGGTLEAAALGINLVIVLDCVMTFFGSAANDAAYNAWLTDAGDESNRGKIEGINAMMPLIATLAVFGGFMSFDLEKADNWTVIYTIIGGIVLIVGLLSIFWVKDMNTGEMEKSSYFENILYSFRLSTLKENKLLYAVIGAFAVFGISIQTYMPYLILYYEQTLKLENYVLIMAPAIILAAIITAFYGRLYDMLGFQKSVVPCVVMLVGGYIILYFSVNTMPVFMGSLFMMSGYLTGMAVFGAKIRDHIPENMAGRFQGIRMIGQVLVPGIIGPVIGAFVLRDAEQIENSDGTFSFLPNKNIWAAAMFAALILIMILYLIFKMIRLGHYELWSEASEKKKDSWQQYYPRPQMKRKEYLILGGEWNLNGNPIKMPYPPQSLLAEYRKKIGKHLTYETSFELPENFTKQRILLHFGAVDQIAEIWVNDNFVGKHEGGYLAFSFDITEAVKSKEVNRLVVKVTDALDRKYPYGKQCKKRGGMWYTPVSGIWQNVWLENVPEEYIEKIVIKPDLEGIDLAIKMAGAPSGTQTGIQNAAVDTAAAATTINTPVTTTRIPVTFTVSIILHNGEILTKNFNTPDVRINLTEHICADGKTYEPKLWCPEEPYLYSMTIICGEDKIESYFALRTIGIKKLNGINRVCLNETPIFLHGVLDQGYYSDGIYLPAEPEEYERDILRMKELGFNFLRKHIKIEPECFYYYCDKHGMLVMQDMVNNGGYSFLFDTALPTIGMKTRKDTGGRENERKRIFREQTAMTIQQLYNHSSIVAYTIFNEGWGQFDSDRMYDFVKKLDDTRLIDSTSGWFAQKKNDFDSEHIYFKTTSPEVGERPLFVSECGGYSRLMEGHYYSRYNCYGYGSAENAKALTEKIIEMYEEMIIPGIEKGICGCVYTQLSDVEDEVNGLYTYDRKVCKVEKESLNQVAEKLIIRQ